MGKNLGMRYGVHGKRVVNVQISRPINGFDLSIQLLLIGRFKLANRLKDPQGGAQLQIRPVHQAQIAGALNRPFSRYNFLRAYGSQLSSQNVFQASQRLDDQIHASFFAKVLYPSGNPTAIPGSRSNPVGIDLPAKP
jgi:hypothetical protein